MDISSNTAEQGRKQTWIIIYILFCRYTKEISTLWSHQRAEDLILQCINCSRINGLWLLTVCFCVCLCLFSSLNQHVLCSSSPVGTKSKGLTPQWDIMAKRVSEVARPSAPMQDEIHELDWTLCRNDLFCKPQWGETPAGSLWGWCVLKIISLVVELFSFF